jgi:hypothetical protein
MLNSKYSFMAKLWRDMLGLRAETSDGVTRGSAGGATNAPDGQHADPTLVIYDHDLSSVHIHRLCDVNLESDQLAINHPTRLLTHYLMVRVPDPCINTKWPRNTVSPKSSSNG